MDEIPEIPIKLIKDNICDSCYDESLHSLVNTPVEQVFTVMKEYHKSQLKLVSDEVEGLDTDDQFGGVVVMKEDVIEILNKHL